MSWKDLLQVKLDDSGKFVEQSNSEYTLWKKLDQFLVSWLISSISETMFRHIATCETAYDIWHTLEMHFLTDSKARVLHLRNLLQTTRKENLSINDYILKMKEFAGSLTASGVNISDEELLLYVLDGLGPEYDAVVANLTSRSGNVSLQEAQFLLHKHEMRLEKQHSAYVGFHETSAFFASKKTTAPQTYPSFSSTSGHQPNQVTFAPRPAFSQNARYNFVPNFNPNFGKGRGRGRNFFKPKVICQLCGKSGHVVLQCYHRFDTNFQGNQNHGYHYAPEASFSSQNNQSLSPVQAFFATPHTGHFQSTSDQSAKFQPKSTNNGVAHMNAQSGASSLHQYYYGEPSQFSHLYPSQGVPTQQQHGATFVTSQCPGSYNPQSSVIASPLTITDQNWYIDSGATHHVTADPQNLALKTNYAGPDQLQVGNGQCLNISHTGSTTLPSTSMTRSLYLQNRLCVPLLSVELILPLLSVE